LKKFTFKWNLDTVKQLAYSSDISSFISSTAAWLAV